ncbi:MAG: adenylate/guanylate cyclase domain-containing protein [Mycobacteriales bacterium]|nr:adenylate/guanylate cyclase domain-containing protein [Mycobacteriales bacterium]
MDLAGFTAMTQAHGDDYAADVHDAFVGALDAACTATLDVECVKHLGDGALLVSPSAAGMLAALRAGVEQQGDAELCLRVRAGVHCGPVLLVRTAHGDDVLGHTVNVAARLAGIAAPGELLMTAAAVAEAGTTACDAVPLGARPLRHIAGPIEAWSLPLGTQDGLIDPVCHMTVGPGSIAAAAAGREWLFCSEGCRDAFLAGHR